MRVLVTRPEAQSVSLCEKIKALGDMPISFPTIAIEPLAISQKLDQFDWLIFISRNAVIHSQSYFPKNFSLEKIKIAAMGKGTADELRKISVRVDFFPEKNFRSETLLAAPEFQNVAKQKIALIQGEEGRTLLRDTLTARGANVTTIAVYRRVLPASDPAPIIQKLHEKALDVIISTSNESLVNLKALIGVENAAYLLSVPLVVVSDRTKTFAKNLGFNTILQADEVSDEAILAVLKGLKHDG